MQVANRYPEPVLKLRDLLNSYLDPEKVATVLSAFELGALAHEGQTRLSGEPYILHPVAVAHILAGLRMDHESITAAILHDTLEDTPVSIEQLEKQFGKEIAQLVDGVTKLDKMKFRTRGEADAESFRKLMLAMSRDLRVIFIKLADRVHNMRTLDNMSYESRRRIARETLQIYAPIADRLGMNNIKSELEDLGFLNLYPWRYRTIDQHLDQMTGHRKEIVENINNALKKRMNDAAVPCRISGRQKTPYSSYRKMLAKDLSFSEVTDFYAFRIITQTEPHCYVALGTVHSLYPPKPGKFGGVGFVIERAGDDHVEAGVPGLLCRIYQVRTAHRAELRAYEDAGPLLHRALPIPPLGTDEFPGPPMERGELDAVLLVGLLYSSHPEVLEDHLPEFG